MSQPEESQEKTSKTDDILLKPVLKDLDELRKGEDLEDDVPHERRRPQNEQDRSDES